MFVDFHGEQPSGVSRCWGVGWALFTEQGVAPGRVQTPVSVGGLCIERICALGL